MYFELIINGKKITFYVKPIYEIDFTLNVNVCNCFPVASHIRRGDHFRITSSFEYQKWLFYNQPIRSNVFLSYLYADIHIFGRVG